MVFLNIHKSSYPFINSNEYRSRSRSSDMLDNTGTHGAFNPLAMYGWTYNTTTRITWSCVAYVFRFLKSVRKVVV